MEVYKIRRKSDGLFKEQYFRFGAKGRLWRRASDAVTAVVNLIRYNPDAEDAFEVISYELKETAVLDTTRLLREREERRQKAIDRRERRRQRMGTSNSFQTISTRTMPTLIQPISAPATLSTETIPI